MFLRRPLQDGDLAAARRVLSEIAHRGPDGEGEWLDSERGVYLGHRRLSIIDLSPASAQPMVRDGMALAFNGELYNFPGLRRQLDAAGCAFGSKGDAEVLLQGWRHWGRSMLDRADGMYAFALWNGSEGILAVDAFGEKPLFVAETVDGVIACSEIAPLARMLGLRPHLDAEGWAAYLSLGFLPQPATVFPGIEMMQPGTMRQVTAGRLGRAEQYWRPPQPWVGKGKLDPVPEAELDRLVETLAQSLEARLITDVPLTLFLSAGVDSGLVAALCRNELGQRPHCLTVSFTAKGMRDEAAAAATIAAYLGLDHQIVPGNVEARLERVSEILGQPSGTVGTLPLEQISELARSSGFKVALTGMGGDELTAGYAKHTYIWRRRYLFAAPRGLKNPLAAAIGLVPKGRGLASLLSAAPAEVYVAVKNYPALPWLRRLPGYRTWLTREFAEAGIPPEVAVPRYELAKVMPAVHLYSADHASMRHGLELRTPFLSRRAVEVVAEWDSRALVAFGQKSVLRRILARYLPDDLTRQPKAGFTFPRRLLLEGAPPCLSAVDKSLVDLCWRHRMEGDGWSAIAVRLRAAEQFFRHINAKDHA